MPALLRGNNNNVIGSPARVMVAEATYPMPTDISHFVDTSTYNPNTTYGWQDLGLTAIPTTIGHSSEVTEWRSEQFGRFLTVPNDYAASIASEFLETTQNNKVLLMLGSEDPSPPAGYDRTYFAARTSFPSYRVAVVRMDRFNKLHVWFFPQAQWTGDNIAQAAARGEAERIPMSFAAYADSALTDPVSGQATFRVDYDQQ